MLTSRLWRICRNFTGNDLLGGLPSNWGQSGVFSNLRVLDLSDNRNLEGALPPNWGTQGAFPSLTTLNLSWTGVNGQLPSAWGSQQSLPNLTILDLSNNIIAGRLNGQILFLLHKLLIRPDPDALLTLSFHSVTC